VAPKRSTDNWQIVIHVSIGPVRFGMTRSEVAKAVGSKANPFKKAAAAAAEPPSSTDEFKVGAHSLSAHFTDEKCDFVQIGGTGLGGPELDGRGFLNRPYDRALAWVRERDPEVVVDDSGLRSNKLGIAFTVAEDKIKSVAVFAPGYA
jgi:hypothetical protein